MSWIMVPHRVNVARKSLNRLKQVAGVFIKYGFGEAVYRLGFRRPFWSKSQVPTQPTPYRLRKAFEELGPTFIKLGQLMSTRQDLFSPELLKELARLQDDVSSVSFEEIEALLNKEWGRPWSELLADFEKLPLATASIAQVHRATLKTGEKVVIKVQRPGIAHLVEQDSALLLAVADLLESYIPELRAYAIKGLIQEFTQSLLTEIDFTIEAGYTARIKENFQGWDSVIIPGIYHVLCTPKVIVEDYIEGLRISDASRLKEQGVDLNQVVQVSAKCFFKMMMQDGLFHGDLHPGNVFVLPPSKVALIDFGSVGVLSVKNRDLLLSMMVALSQEDFESLAYDYLEMSGAWSANVDEFAREIRQLISPHLGKESKRLNHGALLMKATRVAAKYVRIPSDWFLVFKAIASIEGMAKTIDPNFNTLQIGLEHVGDIVGSRLTQERIQQELAAVSRDVFELMRQFPKEMRWGLKALRSRQYGIAVQDQDRRLNTRAVSELGTRIAASIGGVGMMLVAVFLMSSPGVTNFWQPWGLVRQVVPLILLALGFVFIWRATRKA